jgi:hypothetical protein
MGYTTDFIGHVEIYPPLNEQEMNYLTAFSQSRRYDRRGDPYAVPGNPAAERDEQLPAEVANTVSIGQPGYWCDWTPCWEGCCLSLTGREKTYRPAEWLRYLVDHLLGFEALARAERHPQLRGFTFDHELDGLVIGCRRDTKELSAILVEGNQVEEIVLHPADPRYRDYPPLPYEEEIDRWAEIRPRRPRPIRANVLDLSARRVPSKRV